MATTSARNAGDYFASVAKTDMMRVLFALATEVYALRDRQRALESIIKATGTDLGALDEPVESATYDSERLNERDAFVGRVFAAMSNPSAGS